ADEDFALADEEISEPPLATDGEPILATEGEIVEELPSEVVSAGARDFEPTFEPVFEPEIEEDSTFSRAQSRWAKFQPGSWARYRTVATAFENGVPSHSVTETRVVLTSVDCANRVYILESEMSIQIGAARVPRETKTAVFDFWDEPIDGRILQNPRDALEHGVVSKGARAIPCFVRRLERETRRGRETVEVAYSPVVAPYILKRETTRLGEDEEPTYWATTEISPFAAPGAAAPSYVATTAAKTLYSNETTRTSYLTARPGGLVHESIRETADDGRLLYVATTTLLDFHIAR
ncbi:MAG: hypothetical protein HUK22_07520, partial [Thermoguttaceae bacterium]|nr:hypothetical protein [Thermoguttaceae bacterium]